MLASTASPIAGYYVEVPGGRLPQALAVARIYGSEDIADGSSTGVRTILGSFRLEVTSTSAHLARRDGDDDTRREEDAGHY